jgi:XTP/dITP diphosphohydrolase
MTRKLVRGDRLVIASHNPGKLAEFADLLAPYGIVAMSAWELGLPEPEETGTTFSTNALLKARTAAEASGLPALADDSGLEVAALDGAPGIYSARWGGPAKDFAAAMRRVHDEVEARAGWTEAARRASFNATLCLAWPGGEAKCFEGKVFGLLEWPPRGVGGFGYDPMFRPDGADKTFGEMTADEKHGRDDKWGPGGLSHRARACHAFIRAAIAAGGP